MGEVKKFKITVISLLIFTFLSVLIHFIANL